MERLGKRKQTERRVGEETKRKKGEETKRKKQQRRKKKREGAMPLFPPVWSPAPIPSTDG